MEFFYLNASGLNGGPFCKVLCLESTSNANKRIFGLTACVSVKANFPAKTLAARTRILWIIYFVFVRCACHDACPFRKSDYEVRLRSARLRITFFIFYHAGKFTKTSAQRDERRSDKEKSGEKSRKQGTDHGFPVSGNYHSRKPWSVPYCPKKTETSVAKTGKPL